MSKGTGTAYRFIYDASKQFRHLCCVFLLLFYSAVHTFRLLYRLSFCLISILTIFLPPFFFPSVSLQFSLCFSFVFLSIYSCLLFNSFPSLSLLFKFHFCLESNLCSSLLFHPLFYILSFFRSSFFPSFFLSLFLGPFMHCAHRLGRHT